MSKQEEWEIFTGTPKAKNPNKTFIGGLVIGAIAGSILTYIIMANWFLNLLN